MLFVAACGLISSFTGVDVDRYYLQSTPIIMQSLFFSLMLPGTLAMVWEAVRHWGSWQERQMIDPNPFMLRQDDRRSKVEFYLPLIFYVFAWLVGASEFPFGALYLTKHRISSWSFLGDGRRYRCKDPHRNRPILQSPREQMFG